MNGKYSWLFGAISRNDVDDTISPEDVKTTSFIYARYENHNNLPLSIILKSFKCVADGELYNSNKRIDCDQY